MNNIYDLSVFKIGDLVHWQVLGGRPWTGLVVDLKEHEITIRFFKPDWLPWEKFENRNREVSFMNASGVTKIS